MRENTNDKSLIKVNEKSGFYKIKNFFINLFYKNKSAQDSNIEKKTNNVLVSKKQTEKSFIESIKVEETEESKLLKLQQKYRKGEIKEADLTEEQIASLCALYDSQIEKLRKSNELRKQKLLKYRNENSSNC